MSCSHSSSVAATRMNLSVATQSELNASISRRSLDKTRQMELPGTHEQAQERASAGRLQRLVRRRMVRTLISLADGKEPDTR